MGHESYVFLRVCRASSEFIATLIFLHAENNFSIALLRLMLLKPGLIELISIHYVYLYGASWFKRRTRHNSATLDVRD